MDNYRNIALEPQLIFKPAACRGKSTNEKQFIDSIFEPAELREGNHQYFENRIILAPLNETVDKINNQILDSFRTSKTKTYLSFRTLEDDDAVVSVDELNQDHPGLPPHVLKLKKGCIVMLIRNIDCKNGLCNGTRILVTDLHDNVIVGQILVGKFKNNIVIIPRIIFQSDSSSPFNFKIKQFPLKLAFALTISKSKGQTYDHVGVHLETDVFTHAQLYVALSRCKFKNNISVFLADRTCCVNEVYEEILT